MESFVYDGSSKNLQQAFDVHSKGGCVLCPKCGSELLVVVDVESRAKYKIPTGIYCPINPEHMYKRIMLSDAFDEFRRIFEHK